MSDFFWRILPWLAAGGLASVAWLVWPGSAWRGGWLGWANQALLWLMVLWLVRAGIRNLKQPVHPGQSLRIKLLSALAALLFLPAIAVQTAANAIVERGLEVWFDVRVARLLDNALSLARGLYQRVQADVRRDLAALAARPLWQAAVIGAAPLSAAQGLLTEAVARYGWRRAQLIDPAGRVLLNVGAAGPDFGDVRLGESAQLALRLGRVASEVASDEHGDYVVGYAPITFGGAVVALLRAEEALPEEMATRARAIARDYTRYQTLAHNRAALGELFSQAILFITLLIVLLAGMVATVFARRMTEPVGRMADALAQVAKGDFSVEVPVAGNDEFSVLARAFNRMVTQLRRSMASLARAQKELASALKESHQRQRVLEALLAQLNVGVVLIDDAGMIRLVNRAWQQLFAGDGAAWRPGVRFDERAKAIPSLSDFVADIDEEGAKRVEIDLGEGDKMRRIALAGARIAMPQEEGFSGVLLVAEDITELVRSEQARAWAEVARRLAHEIKNPLTPIRLAAERLRRRIRPRLSSEIEVFDACTQAIIDQVDRLQRLVADFSELARAPQPRIQDADAREILAAIADLYRPRPEVAVSVPDSSLPIKADPDQIKQVLINLIENALAMVGADAGKGAVRVFLHQEDGMLAWIVEDDGPGVPDALAERIFDAYMSTREGGTGLGLAIARRIAEEHGGTLTLDRRRHPTRFVLRLPLQASSIGSI